MFNLGVGCDQVLESQVSRVAQAHSEGNDYGFQLYFVTETSLQCQMPASHCAVSQCCVHIQSLKILQRK